MEVRMERIAIIGMGARGKLFARLMQDYRSAVELSAICDTSVERLRGAAREFGLGERQTYSNPNAFFASGKKADGLIICTDDSTHFALAAQALQYGYNVLLEKPISSDARECEALA